MFWLVLLVLESIRNVSIIVYNKSSEGGLTFIIIFIERDCSAGRTQCCPSSRSLS